MFHAKAPLIYSVIEVKHIDKIYNNYSNALLLIFYYKRVTFLRLYCISLMNPFLFIYFLIHESHDYLENDRDKDTAL